MRGPESAIRIPTTLPDGLRGHLSAFLEREVSRRKGLEAAILCGSHATGTAAPHSDVDLCFLGAFENLSRESMVDEWFEYQIMCGPWAWYASVIREHERRGNIATITSMMAHGVLLYGNVVDFARIQEEARESLRRGPEAPSDEEIRRARVRVTDLWDDLRDCAADPLSALWLSRVLVQQCLDAAYVLNQWWAVKPKYALADLASRDASLLDAVRACMQAHPADPRGWLRVHEALCLHILRPAGGWIRESWRA